MEEGSLGIVYICGEETKGQLTILESLLGRKVRGLYGAYDRFVAVVDAWKLEWIVPGKTDKETTFLETHLIAQGLEDVKIQHVAIGKNHCVTLSLDGHLFSWGQYGAVLSCSELGHQYGTSKVQKVEDIKTSRSEVDTRRKRQQPLSTSSCIVATIATGRPHRVTTASKLFFTQVSCGKSHSAAVTDQGDLYTWGRNFEGQLGHVFKTLSKEINAAVNGICAWPKYVSFFLTKPHVVSTCCGNTFTAVLLNDGSVYLLGGSSLRPPSNIAKKWPTTDLNTVNLILEKGSGGEPFVDIVCGFEHLLARTSGGEIFAWGLNTFGQLGHGGKSGRGRSDAKGSQTFPHPVVCEKAIKWAKVFAEGSYSAAITTDNQLYTWGNGSHGKLGHGKSFDKYSDYTCEFAPRRVDALQHTLVGAVVCTDRNLFVFAPSHISRLSPLCGDHAGGYELRIHGSGFWASENVIVRFVPTTDGRLLRGTIGHFCEATRDVVCQIPKFRLPGEYVVEVSMNGKHFTCNGKLFTVFRRPEIEAVSAYDARLGGGEEVTLSLSGSLPEMCRQPIVRFVRCNFDSSSGRVDYTTRSETTVTTIGAFDERSMVDDDDVEKDPLDVTGRLLRLKLPAFPTNGDGIAPFALDISYDGGYVFTPVCVDPVLAGRPDRDVEEEEEGDVEHCSHSQELQQALPHLIWAHDAQLVRVSPNSFLINALPQTIKIKLEHILPSHVAQLVVILSHLPLDGEVDDAKMPRNSCALHINSIEGEVLTCVIPPLVEWKCSASAHSKTRGQSAEWWKPHTKTGFVSQVRVSMNSGRTFLPPAQVHIGGKSSSCVDQVYGMLAPGRLLSLFPNVGMVSGGTQVAIAGDYFHFDTQDAVVKLQWKESSILMPAICLQPEAVAGYDEVSTLSRRVVFQTPSLPFSNDLTTATAMTEGVVLSAREEVKVSVSLDGEHFAKGGLSFMYCAIPEMSGIVPEEAGPGTTMTISVSKVLSTPAACVRLIPMETKVSLVIPVKIDETSHTAEFILPELPIVAEEVVHVALSLNGQEFTEECLDLATLATQKLSFRYNIISVNES